MRKEREKGEPTQVPMLTVYFIERLHIPTLLAWNELANHM